MRNKLLLFGFLVPLLAQAVYACKCQVSLSSCGEVAASDIVFIGTVESIAPQFLDRWNLANSSALRSLNEAYLSAQRNPSRAALESLKDLYIKTVPDMSKDEKDQTSQAKSTSDFTSSFYKTLSRGMRVRFRVKTLFKHEDDDDGDEDESELDVWNPFDECGVDFQVGETYLVYANAEEGSDYNFTSTCTRTRRLSDAGDDLGYLFFYEKNPRQSARLEGLTTSDADSQSGFDPLHEMKSLKSPVQDVLIELRSETLVRYTQPDQNGRFLFDGLPEGDYRVSTYATGFPTYRRLLTAPQQLQIKEKGCARQVLLIPPVRGN